jgi:hypothetical protein
MSIATVEIRSFSGPDLVELDGVNRPAIIRLNVGPAGAPGPNSVTSATTSNGTCDLWLDTLNVGIGTASGLRSVAIGQSTASGNLSLASGSSTASEDYAFATGDNTTASGYASHSSGAGSTASGYAADASGDGTAASGYAAQSQGSASTASADYSVATGRRAKAIHIGASVESDSQDADVESLLTNEKTFRFANGYRFLGGSATFEVNVTVNGILYASHIHGNIAGSLYAHVRAGEALSKGDPVYVSGYHQGTATAIVSRADADDENKMPAVGVMDADLANNASGHMVINGLITNLNTAAYAVNDELYVGEGGGLSDVPNSVLGQHVARVERSNANNGSIIVAIGEMGSSGGSPEIDAYRLARYNGGGQLALATLGGLGTGVSTALGSTANATSGFVTADGTATLTNKTLTSPTINTGIAGTAVSSVLQNRAGSTRPICVLFEDFFGVAGAGTNPWADSGSGSTDAGATGGASNAFGTCRLVTGTTQGNTRTRGLGIGLSNIFIGAIIRYGFAIPDITTVNMQIGFSGGGSSCQLMYQSGLNSGQWVLLTNAGTTTFTAATPQAGNYVSGKRYQVEIERMNATQTRILLEIADWNLANWSNVFSVTVSHSTVSGNWGECSPSFTVQTQAVGASRSLMVDWCSLHLPMILR